MKAPPLVFIRHGETDWNRELRFQGQRDIPLNDARPPPGGAQRPRRRRHSRASATGARRLAARARGGDDAHRACRGGRWTGGASPPTPVLMEANYGDWEGLTLTEIAERLPAEARARDADKWGYAPPNGESYEMCRSASTEWLKTLDGPTFVVAHGGILRALLYLLAGLPAHDAPHLAVPQDRVILFTESDVLTI